MMLYPAFFGPKSFGRNAASVAEQLQDRLILAQKSWLPSGLIVCYQLHYSRFIVGMCRLMNHRWVAAALVTAMLSFPVRAAYAVDKDLPQLDHVVVVIFENRSFDQIVDPNHAPFIYSLAV